MSIKSNCDVVTYCLYLLGGDSKQVHAEHIVAKAYQMNPSGFSWYHEEYKKQNWPNYEVGRRALRAAKAVGLVVDCRSHWRLTEKGLTRARELDGKTDKSCSYNRVADSARAVIKQIRAQPLFQQFLAYRELRDTTDYSLTDLLMTGPDSPKELIQEKFQMLKTAASSAQDQVVMGFLITCEHQFAELL